MLTLMGIGFRQDLLDFKPGAPWRDKVRHFIDESDAVLLFWSSNAKKSERVMEECRYAIDKKGKESIIPVLIKGPSPVTPPPELAELFFNDPIEYLMNVIPGSNRAR